MADNTRLNAGSGGDLIGTDDVGGVKYQVVKLAVGADGAVTLLTAALATETTLASVLTALQAAIPAGDNNIGNVDVVTLPALPAGTNNIGDVDVLSSALPTGAATEASLADVVTAAEAIQAAVEGTVDVNVTNTPAQAAPVVSTSFGNSIQLKATAGYLMGFSVHNKSAGTLWVGLYNAATKTGTVLQYWPVYAGDTTTVTFGDLGLYCGTGIFLQGFTDHDGTNTNAGNELWMCGRVI